MKDPVLIWSFEHDAWWKTAEVGYTKEILEAGWYERAHAASICEKANAVQLCEEIREIPANLYTTVPAVVLRQLCADLQQTAWGMQSQNNDFSHGSQLAFGYAVGAIVNVISQHSKAEDENMDNTLDQAGNILHRGETKSAQVITYSTPQLPGHALIQFIDDYGRVMFSDVFDSENWELIVDNMRTSLKQSEENNAVADADS